MDLTAEHDGWSSIPEGILFLIAGKIECIDDYVRLCAVCRSWYSLATDFYYDNLKQKLNQGPLSMSRPAGPYSKRVNLLNPVSGTTIVRDLPKIAAGDQCWGSPFGWLITCFNLVNPFTGATIPLPPPPEGLMAAKAFLTANPDSDPDNCIVFFLSRLNELAFVMPCRDTNNWSYIEDCFDLCDVTCFKDNLYGLTSSSYLCTEIFLFQMNCPRDGRLLHRFVPFLDVIIWSFPEDNGLPDDDCLIERHLVDLNGELCLCVRRLSFRSTVSFRVYKIDFSTSYVTQVLSLGGHCLFLGSTYSLLCKATYEHAHCEFVSNNVFSYHHCVPCPGPDRGAWPMEVEVWDMLNSKVCCKRVSSTPLYGPAHHWILPPSVNFRKLEDYAPKSIPTPTPEQSCWSFP